MPEWCSGGRRPLIAGRLSLQRLGVDLPLARPVWESSPGPPVSESRSLSQLSYRCHWQTCCLLARSLARSLPRLLLLSSLSCLEVHCPPKGIQKGDQINKWLWTIDYFMFKSLKHVIVMIPLFGSPFGGSMISGLHRLLRDWADAGSRLAFGQSANQESSCTNFTSASTTYVWKCETSMICQLHM